MSPSPGCAHDGGTRDDQHHPDPGTAHRGTTPATLGALELNLSPEQVEQLDVAGAIPLGVPHQVIRDSVPRIAGGKPELLDLPAIPAA